MRDGFIKVAAVTPDIRVADCEYNAEQICKKMKEAAALGSKIIVFPELCINFISFPDKLIFIDCFCKFAENRFMEFFADALFNIRISGCLLKMVQQPNSLPQVKKPMIRRVMFRIMLIADRGSGIKFVSTIPSPEILLT